MAVRRRRFQPLEAAYRKRGFKVIAGVDEAGRGPLAGPVIAAACVLASGLSFPGINDSKLLSKEQRDHLFKQLTQHEGVRYAIGRADVEEIDQINILQATFKAMERALEGLFPRADLALIDGPIALQGVVSEAVVGGDGKVQSIAAASVLAKVTRDALMDELHLRFPQYGFIRNKGYPTKEHREALRLHGPTSHHRKSFSLGD